MSQKYLKWVRQQPCSYTLSPGPNDAHHIIGIGHFGGMGLKAPDILSMPLCRAKHREMHENPDLWPDQWEFVVRTLLKAFKEGVIVES